MFALCWFFIVNGIRSLDCIVGKGHWIAERDIGLLERDIGSAERDIGLWNRIIRLSF